MNKKNVLVTKADSWHSQLSKALEDLPAGTVVSCGCGCAIKNHDIDDQGVLLPEEECWWSCSCGGHKDSTDLADELGPYSLYIYGSLKEHEWHKSEKETPVNGAITSESTPEERLDSLFGYDPYGGK